jgi:hypothetical protein
MKGGAPSMALLCLIQLKSQIRAQKKGALGQEAFSCNGRAGGRAIATNYYTRLPVLNIHHIVIAVRFWSPRSIDES